MPPIVEVGIEGAVRRERILWDGDDDGGAAQRASVYVWGGVFSDKSRVQCQSAGLKSHRTTIEYLFLISRRKLEASSLAPTSRLRDLGLIKTSLECRVFRFSDLVTEFSGVGRGSGRGNVGARLFLTMSQVRMHVEWNTWPQGNRTHGLLSLSALHSSWQIAQSSA